MFPDTIVGMGMKFRFRHFLPLFLLSLAVPARGRPDIIIELDSGEYASTRAARQIWQPVHASMPHVERDTVDGRATLKMTARFAGRDVWRVAWERSGRWDLAACQTVTVETMELSGKGARMILHFRSGAGWYGAGFFAPGGACTTTLKRGDFSPELAPAGWDRIDGIRLSIVNDKTGDKVLRLGRLRGVTRRAGLAIYRNDAGAAREPQIPQFAKLVADSLDRLRIPHEALDDGAVAEGGLRDKRVAILPLNPVLPAACAAEIRRFVDGGGQLIVAYSLPEPLDTILGVRLGGVLDGKSGGLAGVSLRTRPDRPAVTTIQHSWIAWEIRLEGGTEARGFWTDAAGRADGAIAITRNANGYYIGHVLTREDPSGKDRLLLNMIGDVWPETWTTFHARLMDGLGRVAGLAGVEDLTVTARRNAASDATRGEAVEYLLGLAGRLAGESRATLGAGDAMQAWESAKRAHDAYARAYAASLPPRATEWRAVWCHAPDGIRGWGWDRTAKRMADGGMNAMFVNMCWGGGAAYPSRILPTPAEFRGRPDPLEECLAAAEKHGLAAHVWKVNWHLWHNTPAEFRGMLEKKGRLQQDATGQTLAWLCPSDPENRKLETDAMLEVIRAYPRVAGIHMDYIRYPGWHACYCPRCRRAFEERSGVRADAWPEDVRAGARKDAYRQFRRDQITALVAPFSREARKIRPDIRISAAVFWLWPDSRDDIGQDWRLWLEKGYVDFVCPMMYTEQAAVFGHQLRSVLDWAGDPARVVPGIGATLGLTPDGTLEQVLLARRQGAPGFILFDANIFLAEEHLPMLRLGVTSAPAAIPGAP